MKRTLLSGLALADLIRLYIEIAIAQHRALANFETGKFNRLFTQQIDLERELKSRPGDHRSALMPLLDHSDIQVRLSAAYALRPIALEDATRAFERIAQENYYPQTANARFALDKIADGSWTPMPGLD